jgi:GTPase Era involved in 16S rRNA processing
MKFEIKHIEIIDDPGSETDSAQIAQCHVEIGDQGAPGADIFVVDVCNPQWAEEHIYSDGAMSHPSVLIVQRIDEKNIKETVEEKFLNCEYDSFEELASQAAPIMRWEFA